MRLFKPNISVWFCPPRDSMKHCKTGSQLPVKLMLHCSLMKSPSFTIELKFVWHSGSLSNTTNGKLVLRLLGRPTLVGKALSFTHELYFFSFLFYQYTALSSRAVDGYQMYSGGSVVGEASTTGIEISPTPPQIFTGGQKVRNLASFKTSLNLELHAFENVSGYLKCETHFFCRNNFSMPLSGLVKLGQLTPKNRSIKCHTPKIARPKRAKIVNNVSAVDYSVSLRFCTKP